MKTSRPATPKQSSFHATRHADRFTRRRFLSTTLKAGVTVALPQIVPGHVLGMNGAVPPSEQIVLGAIGIGNRGTYVLGCFMEESDVRFVAICDVQAERRT